MLLVRIESVTRIDKHCANMLQICMPSGCFGGTHLLFWVQSSQSLCLAVPASAICRSNDVHEKEKEGGGGGGGYGGSNVDAHSL